MNRFWTVLATVPFLIVCGAHPIFEQYQDETSIDDGNNFGRELQTDRDFSGSFHLKLSKSIKTCTKQGYYGGCQKYSETDLCMEYDKFRQCGISTCDFSESKQKFQYGFKTQQFKIEGYNYCMTNVRSGSVPRLKPCNANNVKQAWDVVPDSSSSDLKRFTIQPRGREKDCISTRNFQFPSDGGWAALTSSTCPTANDGNFDARTFFEAFGPTSGNDQTPDGGSVASGQNQVLSRVLNKARTDIIRLVNEEPTLKAKYVRLGFHDCVGGCDGCVNLNNGDNAGLDIPIDSLTYIVDEAVKSSNGRVTRGDIWALAACVGAEESQPRNGQTVAFEMDWIGRQGCGDFPTRGPMRVLPGSDLDTHGVLEFFRKEFGFNAEETVAIMGAHTIGTATVENSGFDGEKGWVRNKQLLSNEYYRFLVSPNWQHELIESSGKWQWRSRGGQFMLNADIALVRDFSSSIERTGRVTCDLINQANSNRFAGSTCPRARNLVNIVEQYRTDNAEWLNDFRDAFLKMLVNGYETRGSCDDPPCQLRKS